VVKEERFFLAVHEDATSAIRETFEHLIRL